MIAGLTDLLAQRFDEMVDLRRHLHTHPELSFEEQETTAVIRERMTAIGLDELECPTETGAIFALDGERPGSTVLIRADIDALPIREQTGHPWKSRTEGVMHACGHDAHAAIAVGVADALALRAEDLAGRYVFLFQPGEEHIEGAKRMLDTDLLDRLSPDCVLACHMASIVPTGKIVAQPNVALAGADMFVVRASGGGGHAALRDGSDPVQAMAQIATALPSLVGDLHHDGVSPLATAGVLKAGTAFNVVPTDAELAGSLRTFSPAQRATAFERLHALCSRVAHEHGLAVDVETPASTPPVDNDPEVAALVGEAVRQVMGDDALLALPPVTASDDCAEFLTRIPGCYFFVGAALADGQKHLHHSPTFDIDERSLQHGASVLAQAAITLAMQCSHVDSD